MARPAIPALTSIRFIFAVMVLATHFHGYTPGVSGAWMAPLGNIAVSWFFILSGFILAYSFPTLPSAKDTGKFLISRFWRLFPVQAVTVLASYLLFASSRQLAQTEPEYLFASLSLMHAWAADPAASQAFNVPAWSVSHEWFFYLAFPVLIAWGWRSALAVSVFAAAIALAWATQMGCWESQTAFQDSSNPYAANCYSLVYYWPPARLWEFTLGIGVCALAGRLRATRFASLLQCVLVPGATALFVFQSQILALIPYDFFSHFFVGWSLNVLIGCAIILGLSQRGPIAAALSIRPFVFAGEISFSMYMTHMLILRYLDAKGMNAGLPYPASFVAVCALTMLISAAVFLLVERPSRAWLKSVLSEPRLRSRTAS